MLMGRKRTDASQHSVGGLELIRDPEFLKNFGNTDLGFDFIEINEGAHAGNLLQWGCEMKKEQRDSA